MKPYRFTSPRRTLHRAQLDNLVLVPGNLLPYKCRWQRTANSLPRGTLLIILPTDNTPQRKTLEAVASLRKAKGNRVTTLPMEHFL